MLFLLPTLKANASDLSGETGKGSASSCTRPLQQQYPFSRHSVHSPGMALMNSEYAIQPYFKTSGQSCANQPTLRLYVYKS